MIGSVLLLLALALAPIIGGGFGELTNGVLQILVFVGIGLNLLVYRKDAGAWARVHGIWFVGIFAVLCIAATIHSRAIYYSLTQLMFIFACLGAYMLSATVCRDKRVAAGAVWALLLSALFVSAMGVRGYIMDAGGGIHFWRALTSPGDHQRLFGPFINPSFFSGYLVIALPVTLGAYLVARKALLVVLAGIGFVLEVVALMLTGAKFGIIAAVAALALFFILAIAAKSLRRARFVRLLVICVVLLPMLIAFSAPVRSRIQAAESGGTQVHSTVFRIYTWRATANMIKDHPWLGFGPGTYAITYLRYTIAGPTKLAHSSYLQLAAECGVPALVAFLMLLAAIGRQSLLGVARGWTRSSDHPREASDEPVSDTITWADMVPFSAWRLMNCALFAALVGSAVRSLIDSDWYAIGVSLPFWVVAGVLVSQSGGAERDLSPGKAARWVLACLCAGAVVFSTMYAIGDAYAARARSTMEKSPGDSRKVIEELRQASAVAPLDPEYHRQLGLWLGFGEGDFAQANKQMDRAIALAPETSEGGWYGRGLLAGARHDWPLAISSFKTSLKYSPCSTQTLDKLAQAYQADGDTRGLESTLHRLVRIEDSDYEQIKGTPEIVDTTYAFAHVYFGRKLLKQKNYSRATAEFLAAADRLERWRSSADMRKLQRLMGLVSASDEQNRLDLLRDCYEGLAEAYSKMGHKAEAADELEKARKVR